MVLLFYFIFIVFFCCCFFLLSIFHEMSFRWMASSSQAVIETNLRNRDMNKGRFDFNSIFSNFFWQFMAIFDHFLLIFFHFFGLYFHFFWFCSIERSVWFQFHFFPIFFGNFWQFLTHFFSIFRIFSIFSHFVRSRGRFDFSSIFDSFFSIFSHFFPIFSHFVRSRGRFDFNLIFFRFLAIFDSFFFHFFAFCSIERSVWFQFKFFSIFDNFWLIFFPFFRIFFHFFAFCSIERSVWFQFNFSDFLAIFWKFATDCFSFFSNLFDFIQFTKVALIPIIFFASFKFFSIFAFFLVFGFFSISRNSVWSQLIFITLILIYCYLILSCWLDFTLFYRVFFRLIQDLDRFLSNFSWFNGFLWVFANFLVKTQSFYLVLPSFIKSCLVWLSFYPDLLGFTWFLPSFSLIWTRLPSFT